MPFEDLEDRNFYQVLDLEKNDPSGAVHEAFIKFVRKYPPDTDPEGFQAIHLAYRTLMDPKAREEYNTLVDCGKEIEHLVNSSFAAMVQGRLKRAEQVIGKIVEETGGASEALMLLGTAQYEQGHFRDAIKTITGLVERFPRIPLYRLNLGNMIMNRYTEASDDETRSHILKRAREQYEIAVQLDDGTPLAYIEMAKTYLTEKNYETAWEWTEKALGKKEHRNFRDFDPLLFGFVVLSYQDDFDRIRSQVLRLEDCIPEDEQTQEFASSTLIGSSLGLVHDRKIEAARELILLAGRLKPDQNKISGMLAELDVALDADLVWKDFTGDNAIIEPIKEMADGLFEHFMLRTSEDRLDIMAQEFYSKLDDIPSEKIHSSLIRLRNGYPSVWKLNGEYWQIILSIAERRASITPGSGRRKTSSLSWLGVVFVIILILRILSALSDQ